MMGADHAWEEGEEASLPSTPPPPPPKPASPLKTPLRKTRSVFSSLKTHLTVVRAAISHGKSGGGGSSPTNRNTVKEGDLYAWDAAGDDTPKMRTLPRKTLSVMGGVPRLPSNIMQPQLLLPEETNVASPMSTSTDGITNATSLSPQPSTAQKQRKFYMSDTASGDPYSSPCGNDTSNSSYSRQNSQISPSALPPSTTAAATQQHQLNMQSSWSWSENFFFSQDDDSVSTATPTPLTPKNNVGGTNIPPKFPHMRPVNSVKFAPIMEVDDDDRTCNNTIVEKVRQRSKKASRASTVGAFVTFLKALFGIGMLSNPAVLGEVGLLLGTFCHLFIVVGCAFSCYLLLMARQMAKMEVMTKQRRDAEKREEYDMWRAEMERRAAQRAGRILVPPLSSRNGQLAPPIPRNGPLPLPQGNDPVTTSARTLPTTNMEPSMSLDERERTLCVSNTSSNSINEEEWTVAPVSVPLNIPLNRVHTSMMAPKQGWVRCEDALSKSVGRTMESHSIANGGSNTLTPSCGNVQMIRQRTLTVGGSQESFMNDPLNSSETSPKQSNVSPKHSQHQSRQSPAVVSDEYQRFTDKVHNNYMMPPPPPEPPAPPLRKPAQVRLVTYGDVAKYLAGKRASFFIIFTIVTVHLMFASGMVHLAVENLCYVVGWERLGWSYVEEYAEQEQANRHTMLRKMMRRLGPSEDESGDDQGKNNNNYYASRSSDEEEYYLEWKGPDFIGRLAMDSLLFPIIQGLLQIPSLTELATISTVGLVTYAVGCIGSMLYTALVLTDGHPFLDHPDDMWKSKWSGIPTYVATTIYCIEGINLALPTVSSIEGVQRWGGGGLMRQSQTGQSGGGAGDANKKKDTERQDLSVFIVVGAVFLYGMVTLMVSWIGLAGGLGGGIGTIHGEDGCWDVTYCLNSSAVRFVYMLSLGVALILTLPVILYPSTEMLEVWLDERNDERRRKIEQAAEASAMARRGGEESSRKEAFWIRQKSLLPDDETVCTVSDTLSPHSLGIRHEDIEMRELSGSTADGVGAGDYVAPSCSVSSPEPSPMTLQNDNESTNAMSSPNRNSSNRNGPENTKLKAKRKLKYWKLRMFLAFIICVIGTIEGSFPSVLKAAEVIRGVGLSIAGLIFPPLLYMSAVGGNFSVPMAAAMALLIGLGLFNIVLVLMSAFGARDFIVEEGRGNFYEM